MDRSIIERQSLLEAVKALPDEALVELSNFLDYLRYKAAHQRELTTHLLVFCLQLQV